VRRLALAMLRQLVAVALGFVALALVIVVLAVALALTLFCGLVNIVTIAFYCMYVSLYVYELCTQLRLTTVF